MKHYIDAHCHLDSCGTVAVPCIVNAAKISDWDEIIRYARQFPAAIGVHPWYIADLSADWTMRLERALENEPNLMVGEIGLDRLHPDFSRQQQIFVEQMEIAARHRRPVHIHCVRAWDVLLGILASMRPLPPVMVMHGFRANDQITRDLMRYPNIYFSFATPVPAATVVPETRILVESDGRRDICLRDIVREISAMRGTDMTDIIYNNTMRIINHGQTA